MWNLILKSDTNELTKQKQIYRYQNKLLVTKGEMLGGGGINEVGMNIFTPLCIS